MNSLHHPARLVEIFNYGDVTVVGTGASLEPLLRISKPIELRKKIGTVAEAGRAGAGSAMTP